MVMTAGDAPCLRPGSIGRLWSDLPLASLLALASLLPLLAGWESLSKLFFFGDDWDHLDQIQEQGLPAWMWTVFAENFVPLWKLAWGGTLLIANGSHLTLVVAIWITHAATVLLLALLLRQAGMGRLPVAAGTIVFALSTRNIETLAWTTLWTTVMASAFLLGGLLCIERLEARGEINVWKESLLLLSLSACSAFSMVRGVVTGPAMAAMLLWTALLSSRIDASRCIRMAAALIPAVLTALIILTQSRGNHQALGTNWEEMLRFGWFYFALNPLHRLFDFAGVGWRTALLLGTAKISLVGWALCRARPRVRRLLVVFMLFNLGEAVLLGIGRFHTGVESTTSSRYQYLSLLTLAPFLGIAVERAWRSVSRTIPGTLRVAGACLIVLQIGWLVGHSWPRELRRWADARGGNTREILAREPLPGEVGAIPGIPYLTNERARELVEEFNLH